MKSQRGGTLVNVLLILMLAAICALMFMMLKGDFSKSGTTTAHETPTISKPAPSAIKPSGEFSDGLGAPDAVIRGTLDEFGAGIESVAEFNRDINNDGHMDRITRTHVATGNAHDYDEYKIEMNDNGIFSDITPKGFRTTHGADCALRLIQFHFTPAFGATIISRPFVDTWDTPSVATKTEYTLNTNKMIQGGTTKLSQVCDVSDLF
ncbi:MAG: hypothetical protein E7009_00850 [Alphaproteobacteria bacterium]|nr:hypothetical protein [Alphaproteobacteria bacterium]